MRAAFLALALIAVALKVLVPAGFMTAPGPTNGLPFSVVICTGQGAMVVEPGDPMSHDKRTPSEKPSHDQPCPFAGHGAATVMPSAITVQAVTFAVYVEPAARPVMGLAPGRGLAAPPLPARGPPSLLI